MWNKYIIKLPMLCVVMMLGCFIAKATQSMWYLPDLILAQTVESEMRATRTIMAFCNENKDICDD